MTNATSDSEYNNLLEALRKRRKTEAKTEIPRFFEALRREDPNMLPSEIREKIERDMREFWARRTIILYTPEQYKRAEKTKAGKMSAEAKKEIILATNSAAMRAAQLGPDEPKESDPRTFNPRLEETIHDKVLPKFQDFILDANVSKGWPDDKLEKYIIRVEGKNVIRVIML